MSLDDSIRTGNFAEHQIGTRLDRVLAELYPDLSRERIKALIGNGAVTINGQIVRQPSLAVKSTAPFTLSIPPPEPLNVIAQDIPLTIVHEDADLIVIDKPAGMVVHPAAGHRQGTLVNALLFHCKGQLSGIGGVERPGIVHRIDKDTSGLLVVAKSDKAHQSLAAQFADHSISRHYLAVVNGVPVPVSDKVTGNIGRSERDRKKMAVVAEGRGKHAATHYKITKALNGSAVVECTLETGRTHQVRVHMASIGHALLGDPVYAGAQKNHAKLLKSLEFSRQALHAKHLGFVHPITGKRQMHFSETPDDLVELIRRLSV
ncbi:RluA family pseudouridine synthase [Parasphingorhabdus sp. DH2-15]|uniref:RluA family pseudouridine synthase n=1 Tax=Parasphingorhabdus sp. DH2-15 TaxID=3444112 RepID=UPI003F682AE3